MKIFRYYFLPVLFLTFGVIVSCSSDNESNEENGIEEETVLNDWLTESDRDALLFMLEEEKLARDTYSHLFNVWGINQFANIKNSEQSHMNAIIGLLNNYDVENSVLPVGEFSDSDLQNLYDQFILDGSLSPMNALNIGATIEDLDIVDLQDYIDVMANPDIINVFESLKCGSRNHLRSFVSSIENLGASYSPQFLSQEEFDTILNSDREQCN